MHLRAEFLKFQWYQQTLDCLGCWRGRRTGLGELGFANGDGLNCSEILSLNDSCVLESSLRTCVRHVISAFSWPSLDGCVGTIDTEGGAATLTILSVSCANSSMDVFLRVEANTIRTLAGTL